MTLLSFHRALRASIAAAVLSAASSVTMADAKQYTVTAPDGVTLAVQESGSPDGAAVVLIHGLLGSRLDWDAQSRGAELQRFRLISYDLRGHGMSGKPVDPDAYRDGRRWADDLDAVIRTAHAVKPVLVGWSAGRSAASSYPITSRPMVMAASPARCTSTA